MPVAGHGGDRPGNTDCMGRRRGVSPFGCKLGCRQQMLNLVRDAWIPVRRRGRGPGAAPTLAAPHQLAEADVEGFCWSRADFNLACRELVAGLLQLAAPPRDDDEWLHRWRRPDPEHWRRALEPWAAHFELLGPGPRFAQDCEPFEDTIRPTRIRPAASLLFDAPGAATLAMNADLFTARGSGPALPPGELAMALFVLQSYATAGGAGYRVSMRGGGPLVTLVVPEQPGDAGHRLARELWANVLPGPALGPEDAALALPWLRPTVQSGDGSSVGPQQAHSLEAHFGLPRRVRLVEPGEDGGEVRACQLPYGTSYAGWRHPFSPQYRLPSDPAWRTVRARPAAPDQRHWPAWSMPQRQDGRHRPAPVVDAFNRRCAGRFRILAGGWAVDRAKPQNFTIGTFPALNGPDRAAGDRAAGLSETSAAFAAALAKACGLGSTASDMLTEEFLRLTAPAFRRALAGIEAGNGRNAEVAWLDGSLKQALDLAGAAAAPMSGEDCPRRISTAFAAIARRKLGISASGRPEWPAPSNPE